MSNTGLHVGVLRGALALMIVVGVCVSASCAPEETDETAPAENTAEESAAEAQPEAPVLPDSWVIYINDDDSYTEGEITYSIALNLTATNPTQGIAGTYTGSATAKTDTTGQVQGLPLNASAIAESSMLEFTLVDGADTGEGLAPLTAEQAVYSGTGTIVMAAAGSGTIGPAGGGFSNTSGSPLEVSVQGSAVTLNVDISGHTYTFEGTLAGE